jgi:hypothetical protein
LDPNTRLFYLNNADLKPSKKSFQKKMLDLREFVTGIFYGKRWSNPVGAILSSPVIL